MRIKYKTRKTISQVLSIVLLCALGLTAILGVSALSKKLKEDTKVIYPVFEVGGIGIDGKSNRAENSIYTKDAFMCAGLEVKLDFESAIEYQIFYYDSLDKYLEHSEVYDESMILVVPENAAYARIVVTPIWDDDVEEENRVCHWYDVAKYSSQLEITVLKEQPEVEAPKESEQLYSGADTYDVSKGSKVVPQASSFQYQDSSKMYGRTVTKIGVPVHSIASTTTDCVFTVLVVDGVGASATLVDTYTFTIKANTYTSTTVGEWVYFDTRIELGDTESLVFSSTTDTVYFAYSNCDSFENQSGFYTHVLNATQTATPNSADIIFDIWVEKE